MLLTKTSKRNILLFVAAFLLEGFLHEVCHRKDFAISIASLFSGILILIWMVTVQKRVTDRRLCIVMTLSASSLMLQIILQLFRYDFFAPHTTMSRYLWYAMYIPMAAHPTLFLFLVAYIHHPKDKPAPRACHIAAAVGVLLMIGIMTNDFHSWAKFFPNGPMTDDMDVKSGWLYYLFNVYTYGLFTVSYGFLLRKTHKYLEKKARWVPLIPFFIGIAYFMLYPLNLFQYFHFLPTRIWQIGDMYAICLISAIEACIQTGMIPANMGYEIIFSEAFVPAVILDYTRVPVYQTATAHYPFTPDENTKVRTHPILGGYVEWTVDVEQVRKMNQQLEEATQQLETRNAYLAEEYRIKKERAEIETRNRLYEKISQKVQPQFEEIEKLLKSPNGCGTDELARAAVLEAYIKRRSNMELLGVSGMLPAIELTSAVSESLEYVRLCGVNTAASSIGDRTYPAEMVIAAYEHIESIIENSLETLSDMVVTIRSDEHELIVRMMLKADDFVYQTNDTLPPSPHFSRRILITKDKQDMIISLTFREGGEDK